MTYLQLVNKVLTRLREDNVDTVNQSTYSKLIGVFVNDAIRLVEQAWDWAALRTNINVSTTASDNTYSLANTNSASEILYAMNTQSNVFLKYQTKQWFDEQLFLKDQVSGSPAYYTYNGLDANGDIQVLVYPIPDGVYSLQFKTILRGAELENDTDTVALPYLPVVQFATGLAIAERGESGGQSAAELLSVANRMLSDAIALDSARQPEELTYVAV